MDLNVLNSWLLGAAGLACSAVGWLFVTLHKKVESNASDSAERAEKAEKALADFKLHCAETYVTSGALEKAIDRFSASIDAVFKKLEQLDEKFDRRLDMKADK
jgi:hypothetical protein